MKQHVTAAVAAAFLFVVLGIAPGCHRQGPAEHAGEKLDRAGEKVKDAIDPPGPAEKAGRKIDRATGN